MAMFIRTNVASLEAQRHLSKTQTEQSATFQRLSSGYRINGAADDAAGLGISENMNAQVRSYAVAERNAMDGISMAETADGAAGQMHEILGRLRELAVQSSNGSLQTGDRTNLNTEFTSLRGEIDRISNVTKFNGQSLLSGTAANVDFQVGIGTSTDDKVSVSFGGVTSTTLGVNASVVDTSANAQSAITAIDSAISTLSTTREGFGSGINRLQSSVSNIQSMKTNLAAAHSRIKDVDVAEESAQLSRQQVLSQAGVSVLSQANQSPQLALSLLRG
ncbi:MAG: flagellin FliC [Polyangiaceae bacterium]|nr:flagellin FliC [Polyangiaceae bacterium]